MRARRLKSLRYGKALASARAFLLGSWGEVFASARIARVKVCARGMDPSTSQVLTSFALATLRMTGVQEVTGSMLRGGRMRPPLHKHLAMRHCWLVRSFSCFEAGEAFVDFVPVDYVPPGR